MNQHLNNSLIHQRIRRLFSFASCFSLLLPIIVAAQPYTVNISVDNLTSEQREQILTNLSLHRLNDSPHLSEDYIERLYTKAYSEIEQALQVFGYYKSKVSGIINKEETPWLITFTVDAGPPLLIRNLDIAIIGIGRNDKAVREWYTNLPFKSGDTLNQQLYEKSKNEIRQVLFDNGYLEGKITTHELRISLENYYADVVVQIDTGDRFRFGNVVFKQAVFDDKYLRNFLTFNYGDFYTTEKLTELQNLLSLSGEFQKIEIIPQPEKVVEQHIPVQVLLTPRKPQRYTIGLGYGTDTGARIRLGAQRRQLTTAGHHAKAEILYSELLTEYNADYYIPLKKPATDYIALNVARVIEDTDDIYRETDSSSIGNVYALTTWIRTIKLTYLDEIFEIGDEKDSAQLLIPSISFRLIPKNIGRLNELQWRLNLEFKGADEDLMSETTFLQSRVTIFNRLPLFYNFSLVSRADVGWSDIDEFSVLPVSLRFFAGGDSSIRGYGYNTLGPENSEGEVVGGSHLLVGSVELQYQLNTKWDLAAFTDAGNAYNNNDLKIMQGVGVGFGYALPVGSLRAYAASAISKSGLPWRLHITIGAQW
jgi:translocation and assembly module TamA